jgi:pimeloyl-ACP methyl ester carboxylesterase
VPVAVLAGGRDRLTPGPHGRIIAEALPDTELTEVQEAGHLLPMEYPGLVTAAIRRMVQRVATDPQERSA